MTTLVREEIHVGRMMRPLMWGGLIGPVAFAVLVMIAGRVYEGYDHAGQKISELGGAGADLPLLQNVAFGVLGVSVVGFAWALARSEAGSTKAASLIALFGLSSAIGSALLPCDVGCRGETPVALLHNVTGMVGFLAAIAGMVLLARRWLRSRRWRAYGRATLVAALAAFAGLVWFVVTQVTDAQALAGVAQRLYVGVLLVWIAFTAARLLAITASSDGSPPIRS